MKEEWTVKGVNNYFSIEKDSVNIHFEIIIKTQKVMLFCVNVQQSAGEINREIIDISKYKAHKVLGHSGE